MIAPTFTVNTAKLAEWVRVQSSIAGKTMREGFRDNGRLLAYDLMRHTPPFSGKTIVKMLNARGVQLRDTDIQDMSALAVGKRRVEKDIRKIIYGLDGAQLSARQRAVTRSAVNATDWGTLQRVEGRQAVRLFATKSGDVYGVDTAQFRDHPSMSELARHHNDLRGKRGRVTSAGQKTRNVGRWRWLNVLVVPETILAEFIKAVQGAVGEARGGWGAGFIALGGKLGRGGWVGKHVNAGECKHNLDTAEARNGNIQISFINKSRWASSGDPDKLVDRAIEGRCKAIEGDITHRLKDAWKGMSR